MKPTILLSIFILITLSANAQTADFLWARSVDEPVGGAISYAICNDAGGNVYVTGTYQSIFVSFGNDTIYNSDATGLTQDIFVLKYNAAGAVQWVASAGGSSEDEGKGIAADDSGNVYITGYSLSPFVVFGPDTLTSTSGGIFFVTKYDTHGNVIWARTANSVSTYAAQGSGVSVDGHGNVYVTGFFGTANLIFGNDTLANPEPAPSSAVFVARYDASGNVVWANSIIGDNGSNFSTEESAGISVDAAGNSYVTGTYESHTLSVGSQTLTNAGEQNIFTVKYDSSGNVLWANSAGGASTDFSAGIVVDANDNAYITGTFESPTATFGSVSLPNGSNIGATPNLFLAKYNSAGSAVWAKTVGGGGYNGGYSVSADGNGNVYVAGHFLNSSIVFGGDSLINTVTTGQASDNLVATEYDSSGNTVWALTLGSVGGTELIAISSDPSGNVYVTGGFDDSEIILGPDTLVYTAVQEFPGNMYTGRINTQEAGIPGVPGVLNNIIVFPNPSTGQFYFKGIQSGSTLELYDVLGQNISSNIVIGDTYLLNISSQAKGIYFYRVVNNNVTVQDGKIILE